MREANARNKHLSNENLSTCSFRECSILCGLCRRRPATAAWREPAALSELMRRLPRFPQLQAAPVEARAESGRDRTAARSLRLAHTYATFALRAGVPVFALSRFMGTSIAMIDLHYGHLAVDSYQHAVSLLDAGACARRALGGHRPKGVQSRTATGFPGLTKAPFGWQWTLGGRRSHARPRPRHAEGPDEQELREASDGLQPSTPSLYRRAVRQVVGLCRTEALPSTGATTSSR
jgi:hypothetical protein